MELTKIVKFGFFLGVLSMCSLFTVSASSTSEGPTLASVPYQPHISSSEYLDHPITFNSNLPAEFMTEITEFPVSEPSEYPIEVNVTAATGSHIILTAIEVQSLSVSPTDLTDFVLSEPLVLPSKVTDFPSSVFYKMSTGITNFPSTIYIEMSLEVNNLTSSVYTDMLSKITDFPSPAFYNMTTGITEFQFSVYRSTDMSLETIGFPSLVYTDMPFKTIDFPSSVYTDMPSETIDFSSSVYTDIPSETIDFPSSVYTDMLSETLDFPSSVYNDIPSETIDFPSRAYTDMPLETIDVPSSEYTDTPSETIDFPSSVYTDTPSETIYFLSSVYTDMPSETIGFPSRVYTDMPSKTIDFPSSVYTDMPSETIDFSSSVYTDIPSETIDFPYSVYTNMLSETLDVPSRAYTDMPLETIDVPLSEYTDTPLETIDFPSSVYTDMPSETIDFPSSVYTDMLSETIVFSSSVYTDTPSETIDFPSSEYTDMPSETIDFPSSEYTDMPSETKDFPPSVYNDMPSETTDFPLSVYSDMSSEIKYFPSSLHNDMSSETIDFPSSVYTDRPSKTTDFPFSVFSEISYEITDFPSSDYTDMLSETIDFPSSVYPKMPSETTDFPSSVYTDIPSENLSSSVYTDMPTDTIDLPSDVYTDILSETSDFPSRVYTDMPSVTTNFPSGVYTDMPFETKGFPSSVSTDVPSENIDFPSVYSDRPSETTDFPSNVYTDIPSETIDFPSSVYTDIPSENLSSGVYTDMPFETKGFPSSVYTDVPSENIDFPSVYTDRPSETTDFPSNVYTDINLSSSVYTDMPTETIDLPSGVYTDILSETTDFPSRVYTDMLSKTIDFPSSVYPEMPSETKGFPSSVYTDVPSENKDFPSSVYTDIPSETTDFPSSVYTDIPSETTDFPPSVYTDIPSETTDFPSSVYTNIPSETTDFPSSVYTDTPSETTDFPSSVYTDTPSETSDFPASVYTDIFSENLSSRVYTDMPTETIDLPSSVYTDTPSETTDFPSLVYTDMPSVTTYFSASVYTDMPRETTNFPSSVYSDIPLETTDFPFSVYTESPPEITDFLSSIYSEMSTKITNFSLTEISEFSFTSMFSLPGSKSIDSSFIETSLSPDTFSDSQLVSSLTSIELAIKPSDMISIASSPFTEHLSTVPSMVTEMTFIEETSVSLSTIISSTPVIVSTTETPIKDDKTVICLQFIDSMDVLWLDTPAGETRTLSCNSEYSGVIFRKCSSSGIWGEPINNCIKSTIQAIQLEMKNLAANFTEDDIVNILYSALDGILGDTSVLTENDVIALMNICDDISKLLESLPSISDINIVQTFTDIISSVVDVSNKETWESLYSQGDDIGETVLEAMDRMAEVVSMSLNVLSGDGNLRITTNNIDFQVWLSVDTSRNDPVGDDINTDWPLQSRNNVKFDASSLPSIAEPYKLAAMTYRDLSFVLPWYPEPNQELNGQIISFSTFPSITGNLSLPIDYTFYQNTELLTKPSCVYWEFNNNTLGTWSTDGCSVKTVAEDFTICSCDHLTNFAVILSLQDCGTPSSLKDGIVYFDDTTYTSIAEYKCLPGYKLSGNNFTQCLYNGSWSIAATTCTVIVAEMKVCPVNADSRGTVWSQTDAGNTIIKACQPEFRGNITRYCDVNGLWRLPLYNCIRKSVQEIQNQVSELNESTSKTNLSEIVREIRNTTDIINTEESNEDKLTDGEISVLSSTLETVGNMIQTDIGLLNEDMANDFVESASNLIDEANQDSWKSLTESENLGADNLLTAVTTLVEALGQTLNETEKKTVVKKNLAVETQRYLDKDVTFPLPNQTNIQKQEYKWIKDTKSQIQLETESLQDDTIPYIITVIIYRDLSTVLPNITNDNVTQNIMANKSKENQINGPVLSMSLLPKENVPVLFDPPIKLTFEHSKVNLSAPVCSYWKFRKGRQGVWTSDGCWVKSTNKTFTICHCNHLTNFAVLMSPFKQVDSSSMILRIISIVGIIISICCVFVTMVIHVILWKYLRNDRTTILMNLCVSLLFAYIIFLAGIEQTESKIACAIIAGLLQYLYLVVFCVMLVEGIEITITVLYVFKTKSRIKIMLIAAWVLPSLVVGISAGITKGEGYGSSIYCWLSIDNGLIWAFVGPALVVILFNVICIILVMRAMFTTTVMKSRKLRERIRASLRSLCVLVPIMGLSWIVGIFYIDGNSVFVQFLFTILNGLQGLFIFIVQCLLNKQVKNAIAMKRRRYKQETFQSTSKKPPSKVKENYSKDDRNNHSGDDHLNTSKTLLNDESTGHILQPGIKSAETGYDTPLSSYGSHHHLRPASKFSTQSRDQLPHVSLSSNQELSSPC